jgi:ketosteroid isomerase-like protein
MMRTMTGVLVTVMLSTPMAYRASAQAVVTERTTGQKLAEPAKKALLEARESVWRSFFAGDVATLQKLLPEELITVEPNTPGFGGRQAALDESAQFAKNGGKLTKLEFPKTEIQVYGDTAILYSVYVYEFDNNGKHNRTTGRATEIFVKKNGQWVNPAWHMDLGR